MNFKEDIKIDPLNLVDEWRKQPDFAYDYKVEWAKAQREVDKKKAQITRMEREIKQIRSEVDLEVRESPEEYGIAKPTENAIYAIVQTNPKVVEKYQEMFTAMEELAELQYKMQTLNAGAWAFVNRKDALENITKLFLRDYYATQAGFDENFEAQIDGLKKHMKEE